MILTKGELLLVEDDAVGGAEGQVGAGPEKVLLQGLVPEEGIINTFCDVAKPGNDLVVPAGVSVSRC